MFHQFELEGYLFQNQEEYEKAKKELVVTTYIRSNSNLENTTLSLKAYHKFVEKASFQTVIGYSFLKELQDKIKKDNSIPQNKIPAIPIKEVKPEKRKKTGESRFEEAKRAERFQMLYEKEKAKKISTRIIIGFLICIIMGMLLVAQFTPYSIFTNYEEKIIDKYENWQVELEQREAQLNQREQAILEKE